LYIDFVFQWGEGAGRGVQFRQNTLNDVQNIIQQIGRLVDAHNVLVTFAFADAEYRFSPIVGFGLGDIVWMHCFDKGFQRIILEKATIYKAIVVLNERRKKNGETTRTINDINKFPMGMCRIGKINQTKLGCIDFRRVTMQINTGKFVKFFQRNIHRQFLSLQQWLEDVAKDIAVKETSAVNGRANGIEIDVEHLVPRTFYHEFVHHIPIVIQRQQYT